MEPIVAELRLPLAERSAAQRQPLDSGQVTAMVHLYRGEVGRMATYRQRLDTTTNWAITSSALVTTFSLGNAAIPHAAFLFMMLVNLFFLIVEARRFKVYEEARYRVLLLERYFYPEVLGEVSAPDWRSALLEALRTPFSHPLVSTLGALAWRLRRNYLWIYAGVLLTWIAKLEIAGGPSADLIAGAALGRIPGFMVWAVVLVGYGMLTWIGLCAERTYPLGDENALIVLRQEPD
jgi:uncharacterized membrane protein